MARPVKLTSSGVDWVKDVVYNAAGQITSMKYTRDTGGNDYYTESRQYNVLGQMTQIQIPGGGWTARTRSPAPTTTGGSRRWRMRCRARPWFTSTIRSSA